MPVGPTLPATLPMTLHFNGRQHDVDLDVRTTLLDALRDHLELPGAKKGATTASAVPARCSSTGAGRTPA